MASFLEDGDDFSNNLASDIAPLLSLFGENVTTQFMSQSMGWADCIMLAMAPVGVITIMVSAIRVGGYKWLKAIVGRARENIVAAELEVMSSTSKEACELWNGRNVVRCAGAADICELICIYPTGADRDKITSVRIMDIEQATLQENKANDHNHVLRNRPKKRELFISLYQWVGSLYGLRYCLYGLRYCLYGLRYCLYGLRYCLYGLRYCLYGLRYCLYGLRYCLYGLRCISYEFPSSLYEFPSIVYEWLNSLYEWLSSLNEWLSSLNEWLSSLYGMRCSLSGWLSKIQRILRLRRHKRKGSDTTCSDPESGLTGSSQHGRSASPNEIIIVRNRKHSAPNISLNCQAHQHRWALWLCAAFVTVLQAGVLIYFGLVTEYPTLKFEKDGQPVQGYTMPLSVASTLSLVAGMLICAHVVNKASEEKAWEVIDGKGHSISMVWLQKRKQVSDQQFQSTAIYPVEKLNQILTSERAIGVDRDDINQPRRAQRAETNSHPNKEKKLVRWLQILSLFGVSISLLGTVGQFTGLRGMHWTASIAQLSAVVVATVVRGVIRWALATNIKGKELRSGYELDWFVTSLSNIQTAAWLPPDKKSFFQKLGSKAASAFSCIFSQLKALLRQSGPANARIKKDQETSHLPEKDKGNRNMSDPASSCLWIVETGLPKHEMMSCARKETGNQQCRKDQDQYHQVDGLHTAQSILDLRRYLGELCNWKSSVFAEAVALSKAIEITMGYFEDHLKTLENGEFTWTMQVKVGYDNKADLGDFGAYGRLSNANPEPVEFHVEKTESGWQARVDELDAALSLWLYSVYSSKGTQEETRAAFPSSNDDWIRGKKIQEQCLQVIGPFSLRLVQDLQWWMPNSLEGIMTSEIPKRDEPYAEESFTRDIRVERIGRAGERSPGFGATDSKFSDKLGNPMDGTVTSWNMQHLVSWDPTEENAEDKPGNSFLLVESQSSLARLYAKDMLASFVRALADQLKPSSVGETVKATVQPGDTGDQEAWKSFTLRSSGLSLLVHRITELGPWGEREAYLSLIPPMSASDNLPSLDAVVEFVLEAAAVEEDARRYRKAVDAHVWLYNTAKTFPLTSQIYWKSVAALMRLQARLDGPAVPLSATQFNDWHFLDSWDSRSLEIPSMVLKETIPMVRQTLQKAFDVYHVLTQLSASVDSEYELAYIPPTFLEAEGTKAPHGSSGHRDIFNRTGLHHAAGSTSVNESYGTDRISPIEAKSRISEICGLRSNATEWTRSLSCQQLPDKWNPIGWPEEFTDALVEPVYWIKYTSNLATDPNARDLDHWTALHYACYTVLDGHGVSDETVKIALTDFYHSRALSWARLLIRSKADVNAQGLDGMTPLHCAAMSRDTELVDLLIENNANVAAEDARGLTALHLAAMWNAPALFKRLSRSPGGLEVGDHNNRTPLHFAALSNATEAIHHLHLLGASIDARDYSGQTPLHFAAMSGSTDSIRQLQLLGASVDLSDNRGQSPLHFAARLGATKSIIKLCSLDAMTHQSKAETALDLLNVSDHGGRNLLHYAAEYGHVELAKFLIAVAKSPGKMLYQKDELGNTPRRSVRWERNDMTELLDEAMARFEEPKEVDEPQPQDQSLGETHIWRFTRG